MVDVVKKHECLEPMESPHQRQKQWANAVREYNLTFDLNLTRDGFRNK